MCIKKKSKQNQIKNKQQQTKNKQKQKKQKNKQKQTKNKQKPTIKKLRCAKTSFFSIYQKYKLHDHSHDHVQLLNKIIKILVFNFQTTWKLFCMRQVWRDYPWQGTL